MRVLVIGSGGREHALAWKVSRSPRVTEVFCAPGNAGISKVAQCVDIAADDVAKLVEFARDKEIGLTIVGPEAALTLGIVDAFESEGLKIFGATRQAAKIESSKAFAKDLMKKYGIPTGFYGVFEDPESARGYVREKGVPIVVKADGLAAGKGVIVCRTEQEAFVSIDTIMVRRAFGSAGGKVVIEECLIGEEASFIALTDGRTITPLPSSQDHKAVYDGDEGPNTGGMGAYSPAPVLTAELEREVMETVMTRAVEGMASEGIPYKGVLYAGLMIADDGPKVLEFNARFGDPETQPILARMRSDIVTALEAVVDGRLGEIEIELDPRPAVCVVMASGGYPGSYDKGIAISGLDEADAMDDLMVFHAGTTSTNGAFATNGGRVLGVTALGDSVGDAIEKAYAGVEKIAWEGVHYRRDIGQKALGR